MLHRERDRIERILQIGKDLPVDNGELIGHWGRYSCIACSGYIEVALRLVIQGHVKAKATSEISAYVIKSLEGVQNPKAEKFVKVIRSFSEKWAKDLEDFFAKNDGVKDAIDSLMANRHLIAHGRPSNISIGRVDEFYRKANKVIEYLDGELNPG